MSFNAGEVYAVLGAKVNTGGFAAYDQAISRAAASAERGEAAQKRYDTALAKSQTTLHNVGRAATIGAGAGILGLAGIIAGSVKSAADFESQLSSLQSVSAATGKQMGALKKSAMDAGAATKFSALDAAKAQTELAKGGLSVTKILGGGLKGALALAAAGEMDLATAASTTANALNLFKLGGDQATHVADALATAANSTTADVGDFAMALTQGGAAAKAAGMSFDSTVAYLEALANAGVKGSDAGTSMKTALTQIANPSKQAAGEMKKLNLEFFDAQGKIKPLPAIAKNLDEAFGGLTSKQRLQAAATIAGTDGMRGLLALFDSSPAQLERWEKGLQKQGTAAEVAAKKQDNLKGKIENFKGSLETAGIALGDHFLPILTDLAVKGTDAINKMVKDGSIDDFADGLIDGGEKAVDVIGDIGSTASQVVGDLAPVAGMLGDIAGALDLGSATGIESVVAGLAGFKVAGVVAPQLVRLAGGIKAVQAASSVGGLAGVAALLNPYTAAAVAVGALATGLVILGSRESDEEKAAASNTAAHKAQAEAIKSVMDAEAAAADKGLAAKQSTLDLKQAQSELNDARKKYGKDSPQYAQALISEQQAALRSKTAHDAYTSSIKEQTRANDDRIAKARQHISEANSQVKDAGDEVFVQSRTGNANDQAAAAKKMGAAQAEQASAVQAYVQAVARANVSDASRNRLMNSASQISEKNVQGISKLINAMDGLPTKKQTSILLTGKQAVLSDLGNLAGQLTALGRKRTVATVLANANSANAAVLAFRAILAGVPSSKVAKVLASTSGAAEVAGLKALIANINSKSVAIDVTTRYRQIGSPSAGAGQGTATPGGMRRRAAGRGADGAERALVGEGRHAREAVVDPAKGMAWMVDRPTIMDLPDTAYVIPEDPAMRGRAMGLLSMLAGDLGLQGFAKGKAPAKKPAAKTPAKAKAKVQRDLPGNVAPTSLPLADIEKKRDTAKTALDKAKGEADRLPKNIKTTQAQIRDIERRKPKSAAQKANKRDDLARAKKKLDDQRDDLKKARAQETRQRKAFQAYEKERIQAVRFQAQITKQEQLADTAASQMRTADSKDDQGGYDKAKGNRLTALKKLGDLLGRARKALADQDSEAARELDKTIASTDSDVQDTQTSISDQAQQAQSDADKAAQDRTDATEKAAQDEADTYATTGMSAAERARLSEINKNIALAALTETLTDDTSAAGSLVDFFNGELAAAPGRGMSNDVIADLASSAKQARDNLKSITTGGSNTDENLQAQLDRANERSRISDENARLNRQALEVFGGGGDIGSGGRNAMAAATSPTVVFQSYVPPSTTEAQRLAGYVNGGNGLQGSREAKREAMA